MPAASARRSPLALLVLALLAERPMHPYLMFQLIKQRAKDAIVNISQRNSLYQVIDRLVRSGLAEVDSTSRDTNRPERTVYRITALGRETVLDWVADSLASAKPEYPGLPVALSLLMMLAPAQAQDGLRSRMDARERERDGVAKGLADAAAMGLPRLFVLDDEYRLAMIDAELAWLGTLLAELESGTVTWSAEWIAEIAARFDPS